MSRYPRYKETGVPWLGAIPSHWEALPIKRLAGVVTDRAESRRFPVALENIESWTGRYLRSEGDYSGEGIGFEPSDILFGKLRPYLAKGWVATRSGEAIGDFHVLRHVAGVCPHYLQRFLLSPGIISVIDGSTYGAKMPRASWEFMGGIVALRPPFEEQRAIAAFLDRETAKIDALVAEQERLLVLLEEKRQAVIANAVTKGLDPTVPMKDSGVEWLGQVPAHWLVLRARHVLAERDERSEFGDEELLTVSHLTGVTRRSDKDVNMFEAESMEGYKVCHEGDLVINTLWAWMGALGVSPMTGIVSPAYHVYSCRSNVLPSFVGNLFRVRPLIRELERYSKGVWSSRLRLYPQELFQIGLPVPPALEQNAISAFIASQIGEYGQLAAHARAGAALLHERRAALVSAAVTGKLDVRAFTPATKPALAAE